MSSLSIQEAVIFALVILFFSYETNCSRNPNKEVIDTSLSSRSHVASEINLSSRFKRRTQCVKATDECCVKKRIFTNGRVSFECRSAHVDCFGKSNSSSPSFGLCEKVVNRKNFVVDCQCAAGL